MRLKTQDSRLKIFLCLFVLNCAHRTFGSQSESTSDVLTSSAQANLPQKLRFSEDAEFNNILQTFSFEPGIQDRPDKELREYMKKGDIFPGLELDALVYRALKSKNSPKIDGLSETRKQYFEFHIQYRDSLFDAYRKTKNHVQDNIIMALIFENRAARPTFRLGIEALATFEERSLWVRMAADLEQMKKLLASVQIRPGLWSTQNKEVLTQEGYKFSLNDTRGRSLIRITREKDNFFWDIGIAKSYYHLQTNGNLADVKEAFASTKHLF